MKPFTVKQIIATAKLLKISDYDINNNMAVLEVKGIKDIDYNKHVSKYWDNPPTPIITLIPTDVGNCYMVMIGMKVKFTYFESNNTFTIQE